MVTRYKILASTALATLLMTGAASALELTAAHVNPPGEPSNVAFAELEKLLAESSSGLSLTVFPQGQIGGEKDAIEQVQIGAISMTTVANAALSAFAPSVGIFDIPFLFRDGDAHPWKVVDSELGAEIEAKIEAESNLEVLGWWSGRVAPRLHPRKADRNAGGYERPEDPSDRQPGLYRHIQPVGREGHADALW